MITDDAVASERPFPLLVIVGTEDDRVSASRLATAPERFRKNGHQVEVIQSEGVGHRWHAPLNGEIWRFLERRRLADR